jgi:hypothetical protein
MIAEVIAGAVSGIVQGTLSFVNKVDAEFSDRIGNYAVNKREGASDRNKSWLAFAAVGVVLVLIIMSGKWR